jgi:hypothetical protein
MDVIESSHAEPACRQAGGVEAWLAECHPSTPLRMTDKLLPDH